MDLQLWKKIKRQKKLTFDDIAKNANLPKGSVQNIFCGYVQNPRIDTVQKIERALGIGFTEEELAAGISPTVVRNVDPDEDDLLEAYRELGLKKGKPAQELALKLIEELKNI